MFRRGLDRRIEGDLVGRTANRRAVDADQTGRNRGLGAGAAFEQSPFDQQPIDPLAGCHRWCHR